MKDGKIELINDNKFALRQINEVVSTFIFTAAGIGAIAFAIAGAVIGIGLPALAAGFAATALIGTAFISEGTFNLLLSIIDLIKNPKIQKSKIKTPSRYKLLKISEICFSSKIQNEVFLTAMADWDKEIFELLEKNKDASLFMINARNTYAFLAAMWLKSPIGDLIQFVIKIAKQ